MCVFESDSQYQCDNEYPLEVRFFLKLHLLAGFIWIKQKILQYYILIATCRIRFQHLLNWTLSKHVSQDGRCEPFIGMLISQLELLLEFSEIALDIDHYLQLKDE